MIKGEVMKHEYYHLKKDMIMKIETQNTIIQLHFQAEE